MCTIMFNGKRYLIEDVDGKVGLSVQNDSNPKRLLDVFESVQEAFQHVQSIQLRYGLVALWTRLNSNDWEDNIELTDWTAKMMRIKII